MNLDEEVGVLLSSATLVLAGTLVFSTAGLVERVIVARWLSKSAYGEINSALAILTLGMTLSVMGLYQGVPRFMSRFDNFQNKRGVYLSGLLTSLLVSTCLAGILVVSLDFTFPILFEDPDSYLLVLAIVLAIPFGTAMRVTVGGVRGMEQTLYRVYIRDLGYRVGRVFFVVVFLLLGYGVVAMGFAVLAATILGFVGGLLLLNKILPLRGRAQFNVSELVRFSIPLSISTIIVVLLVRTDTLMLAYFKPSADVGLYGAAFPLSQALLLALSSFGYIYLPLISRLDEGDEHAGINRVYELSTKWIFVVTFPPFLLFTVFGEGTLSLFFGDKYAAASTAFAVLSLGFFTNAAAGRSRETISALGYPKYNLAINGIAFLTNIALNLVLIPLYSYLGAAVASAAAFGTINILAVGLLKTKFGISPFSPDSIRTFVAVPVVLLPIGHVLSMVVPVTPVTFPLLLIGFGIASLVVVVSTRGVRPEDAILLDFIEEKIGTELPFVWGYVPDTDR